MQSVIQGVCILLVLTGVSGCGGSLGTDSRNRQRLPTDVAGTWQARNNAWRIVLTKDGRVDSAVIPLGNVEIRPRKTTRVEMLDGSISTYKAGDCTVDYDARTRELRVEVVVEHVEIVFLTEQIEGHTRDVFIGIVSPNGKVWETDWLNFFDLGERFPVDPNDIGASLTFDKIAE